MKLIVIIPAYNEAATIKEVIKQVPQEAEVVVIDDGSKDDTVIKAKEAEAHVISHSQNQGVGAAFHTGIDYALSQKADVVVNIDADGQYNPLDIPRLVQPVINDEADFVTASRFLNGNPKMPGMKLWGNKMMSKIISRLTNGNFSDVSSGFRAYGKEALFNLNLFGKFTYTQETFLDLSFKNLRIKEVPVEVKYFAGRRSRVCPNIFAYARNTLSIILRTVRDYHPLKFFGAIGLAIFSAGGVLDIFILSFYLQTGGFTPYKAVGLAGVLLNLIGLAVIFLGLLADMIHRLRMNQEKLLYYEKKRKY